MKGFLNLSQVIRYNPNFESFKSPSFCGPESRAPCTPASVVEMAIALDHKIHIAPNVHTKCEILRQLWNINVQHSTFYNGDLNYDVYFNFYTDQCQKALYDGGRHASVRSHRDILEISHYIKNSMDRDCIKQIISSRLSSPKPVNEDE
jgi:hypothetical protein